MGLAFFGLTSKIAPQFRKSVFKQIHEICFHGQGGYDWQTVYNMPIWLRKFTFNEINNYYKERNNAAKSQSKDSNSKTMINPDGTINTPEFMKASSQYKNKASYK